MRKVKVHELQKSRQRPPPPPPPPPTNNKKEKMRSKNLTSQQMGSTNFDFTAIQKEPGLLKNEFFYKQDSDLKRQKE